MFDFEPPSEEKILRLRKHGIVNYSSFFTWCLVLIVVFFSLVVFLDKIKRVFSADISLITLKKDLPIFLDFLLIPAGSVAVVVVGSILLQQKFFIDFSLLFVKRFRDFSHFLNVVSEKTAFVFLGLFIDISLMLLSLKLLEKSFTIILNILVLSTSHVFFEKIIFSLSFIMSIGIIVAFLLALLAYFFNKYYFMYKHKENK